VVLLFFYYVALFLAIMDPQVAIWSSGCRVVGCECYYVLGERKFQCPHPATASGPTLSAQGAGLMFHPRLSINSEDHAFYKGQLLYYASSAGLISGKSASEDFCRYFEETDGDGNLVGFTGRMFYCGCHFNKAHIVR
jgi:hypothetical protein